MEAVIFSNFPRRLINETIEPKLAKFNIRLTRKYFGFTNFTIKQGEDVFVMNEMCSHSEVEKVLAAANKVKANVHYLSRKSSAWESQFKVSGITIEKEDDDMSPTAVMNPNAVLEAIAFGKSQGRTWEQIADDVAKYWGSGKTNGPTVKTWASNYAKKNPNALPTSYRKYKSEAVSNIIRGIHNRTVANMPAPVPPVSAVADIKASISRGGFPAMLPAVTDPGAVLEAIVAGKLQGKTYDEIADDVTKYWRSGKTNGPNLLTWSTNFAKKNPDLVPDSYKKFKAQGSRKKVYVPNPAVPVPATTAPAAVQGQSSHNVNDDLLAIADAEIADLKAKLKSAPVSGNVANLKANKELIMRGIQTGLFTKDSAFEKLCEMIDRC